MVITTDSHYKEEQDIESHSTFVEIGTEREVGETYTDCYLQPYNRLKENALKLYDEEVFNKCVEETNKIIYNNKNIEYSKEIFKNLSYSTGKDCNYKCGVECNYCVEKAKKIGQVFNR